MSAIVVDAGVGVKWFVPEVHAAEARQWRTGPDALHAPACFFDLEIANVLWKKVRRAEIARADAGLILGQLPSLPLTRHPEAPCWLRPLIWPTVPSGRFTTACTWR